LLHRRRRCPSRLTPRPPQTTRLRSTRKLCRHRRTALRPASSRQRPMPRQRLTPSRTPAPTARRGRTPAIRRAALSSMPAHPPPAAWPPRRRYSRRRRTSPPLPLPTSPRRVTPHPRASLLTCRCSASQERQKPLCDPSRPSRAWAHRRSARH
jgi:hypothetical protein